MRTRWLISWAFTFPLFKLLTGVEIVGSVPKRGAVILACNHVSFLDPPLVAYTAFREVYFLAKAGLFSRSKVFSRLITAYNAVSIDGSEGLRKAVGLLRKGAAVVIFPEGTRSRTGGLLPFNPGIGFLAISFRVPVVPVYIRNSNRYLSSLIMRFEQLRITFGAPVMPDGYDRTKDGFGRFSREIRDRVLSLQ